jgi:hypothetical protein
MKPLLAREIVQLTVGDVFGNLKGLAAVAGLWILLVLALLWPATSIGMEPLVVGALLLNWFGMFAVAVAWHRHVIRGDRLVPPMAPPQLRVLLYALWGYLLLLPGSLVCLPALALGSVLVVVLASLDIGELQIWIFMVPFLPAVVLYAIVTARLVLVLPAIAVNDRAMTFRRSWELTRGNTWQLIAATLLLGLLLAIGFAIVAAVAWTAGVPLTGIDTGPFGLTIWYEDESAPSPAGMTASFAAADLLSLILSYLGVALFASFLSLVYMRLAESGAETTSPSSSA